ncbi:MAG: caspase family protein [Pyrinomonadaceae bacterium]
MIEGKRRAVVVGINKYKDGGIPELRGAENDAQGVFDRLKNPDIGNFEIADHHFLIGAGATCEQIRRAVSDVFWKTSASDVALFYFSGHGFVDGYDDGYIAPFDFDTQEPFVCGANMTELKHVLSRSVNTTVILILDCCYSGIATVGEKSASDPRATYVAKVRDLGEGRIILASCTPDQKSRETIKKSKEELTHGTFTYHLLKALDGAASDEQGFISLATLQEYLGKQFRGKGDQTPRFLIEGSNLGDIRLALATEKYYKNISGIISEAKRFFSQDSFASLVEASKKVLAVRSINAKHKEALELEEQILKTLNDQKDKMQTWVTMHEANVRPSLNVVFPEFDRLVDELKFDELTKLPERDVALLITLNRVANGELTLSQFVTKCRPFNDPASRPQAISDAASRPAD